LLFGCLYSAFNYVTILEASFFTFYFLIKDVKCVFKFTIFCYCFHKFHLVTRLLCNFLNKSAYWTFIYGHECCFFLHNVLPLDKWIKSWLTIAIFFKETTPSLSHTYNILYKSALGCLYPLKQTLLFFFLLLNLKIIFVISMFPPATYPASSATSCMSESTWLCGVVSVDELHIVFSITCDWTSRFSNCVSNRSISCDTYNTYKLK